MSRKIIAIVGMPGSGKSEVAKFLLNKGFSFIRLGQLTLDELKRRGLPLGEASERSIRERLRKKYGMAAFAILNFPKIDKFFKASNVVVDGLYSWEEYLAFKEKYGKKITVVAVYASPEMRYLRLNKRIWDKKKDPEMKNRPFTKSEAKSRDQSQLENLHSGGPIAMADYTIINDGTLKEFYGKIEKTIKKIKNK